jgi:hypothetical protein
LNIALFDEIQTLSEANSLHPTALVKEEVILELVEEDTIKVIEVNSEHVSKKSSVGKWIGLASIGIAAVAVGVAGYQRYVQKK